MTASRTATAVAHSNIALSKYWGKLPVEGNYPAVPSLSVTLGAMSTTTTVRFDPSLAEDTLVLNGEALGGATRPTQRASELLERVRRASGVTDFASVHSANDFPTASGLASSASGFAALALAAVTAAGLDWSLDRVADLARRSSASAARSIFGGFVALEDGVATPVAPPSALAMRVLVCVTTEAAKTTSSTDGMRHTQDASPYYAAWLQDAPKAHAQLRAALAQGDWPRLGQIAERSALAMHACAMAAGVVYMTGATLAALAEVRTMRSQGILAYATIDAGPHLKCLVREADAEQARARLAQVAGVIRVLESAPGQGARIVPGL